MNSVGATARTPNAKLRRSLRYEEKDERLPLVTDVTVRSIGGTSSVVHDLPPESDSSKYLKIGLYGLINAIILVPLMISFSQIIFRDPVFQPYLAELVKLTMVSGAVHQICFSALSTLPFAVGQVQDAGLIFLSAMASSIVHSLHTSETVFKMEEVLSTTLFTLCGSTALLGIALVITGKLRWASFVQYLPMPVIGGYFAFIGFFCLQAGMAMMSGKEVKEISDWVQLANMKSFLLCFPGVVAGVFIWIVTQHVKHFTVLPACMATILVLFYGSMVIFGCSFEDARAYGWIAPLPNTTMNFRDIYKHFRPSHFHAEFLLDQLPTWIAMYFVVAFSSSLDVAAIEMALHKPLDHNAELQTVGWSNLVSGLTGGFTGSYIFLSTIFSMKSGVDSRLTGVLVFILELALVASPFSIISYVPKLFFASLQTLIFVDLFMEWIVHARKSMYVSEYAIVWFTFLIMIFWNLQGGIVLGIVVAAFNFIFAYVESTSIRRVWRQSQVKRQFKERIALLKSRAAIVILELDGYIFFGSSVNIMEQVRKHVLLTTDEYIHLKSSRTLSSSIMTTPRFNNRSTRNHPLATPANMGLMAMEEMDDYISEYNSDAPIPACRTLYLVLDFARVQGIDVTAVRSCFNIMKQMLVENGISLVFANLPKHIEDMLRLHDVFDVDDKAHPTKAFETLDMALEWCEDGLLAKELPVVDNATRLLQSGRTMQLLDVLLPKDKEHDDSKLDDSMGRLYIQTKSFEKGEIIYSCGGEVDGFYVVGKGLIDVYLPSMEHKKMGPGFSGRKRIVQVTNGGLLGDIDMILNKKHSFTAEAKTNCFIFFIKTTSFQRMKKDHPHLAARFEKALMRSMALNILEARFSDE
ncbi:hypothetical protein AeRB84_005883 [Aphanomyces euteiches]|nr:hypothetical protein AeRB84_017980 [Aphanomyces euteiches]KAH9151517.1 hypothetical protein AeRB84_005883 [Aphanomyces euteiches]